ncbi:zinc finger protein 22-like [Anolis sagrei]|uniref:zinc finger protein 22-like n=1 Tax=Anolis sagrei TaxID=38937 RepID=UPI00352124F9
MEGVEESSESVASPEKGDSKEKSKKETMDDDQDWDHDAAYISPEGTYLTPVPPLGGNERSQLKPPEFEKNFPRPISFDKGERAAPTEENVHRCLDCGKTFNLASKLKLHQKIHSEEKPFECPECGRHFRHKGNLQTHQRIHVRDKPFRCEECGRCFSYSWILQKHLKFHESRRGPVVEKAAPSWVGPQKDHSLNGEAIPPNAGPPAEVEVLTRVVD